MRRIGPLLMTTMLVTGCAGLATNNESVRAILERSAQSQPKLSAYEQGKRYLQLGRAGLAVDAFQAVLKDNPNSIEALNGLAVAYDRLGRGDVAQRFLDQALTLDPNSAVTLNNLAYLNLVQGNTAVALAYAERAKIAADLPMEMMLPDTIANTVDRTVEIASQLATSEKQERPVAQAPVLPPESDIKRVGLNEWELRIRPPNPADAVRINLPAAAPRVIEPMAQAVAPPTVAGPLPEAAVMSSEIPDSVFELLAPAPEPAPVETVVASLPEPTFSEPARPEPAAVPVVQQDIAPLRQDAAVSNVVLPFMGKPAPMPSPEPVVAPLVAIDPVGAQPAEPAVATISEPMLAPLAPLGQPVPSRPAPVVAAIAAPPSFIPSVPPQPLPEPVREEPVVAMLPAPEPLPTFPTPMFDAVAAMPRVIPVVPPQRLLEPAREEPVATTLPAPEPVPMLPSPVFEAVAAMPRVIPAVPPQQLPEPVREEPVVAVLPAPAEAIPFVPSQPVIAAVQPSPEPARSEQVVASLAVPVPKIVPPQAVAPMVAAPATSAPPAAPMVASLAPASVVAPGTMEPAGLKTDWRASVPSGTVVRVSNGTGRRLMASRFARYFGEHGLFVRRIANANSFNYNRTELFYNPDQRAHAEALAAVLPFGVRLVEAKQGRGQIELVLGFDLLGVDDSLRSA